jgi:hypothetical protein
MNDELKQLVKEAAMARDLSGGAGKNHENNQDSMAEIST